MRAKALLSMGVLVLGLALDGCAEDPDPTASCGPPTDQLETELACTGLYANFRDKAVAPSVRAFAPATSLWSDGYSKSRFIALPPGTQINATDMDDWNFPVGTKVWKEFRDGDRKIETRLYWKQSADRWLKAAYVWSEDGTKASRGEGKSLNVNGKDYTVPTLAECDDCHRGRKDKLLGFEALSLAQPGASGMNLAALVADNRLAPAPSATTVSLPHPGLAVLHVNCGVSCHNATPTVKGADTTLRLRLGFAEVTSKPVETWELYRTTVGVRTELPGFDAAVRVSPNAPEASSVVASMRTRLTGQMPPLATREVDVDGVAAVESWVKSLPPR